MRLIFFECYTSNMSEHYHPPNITTEELTKEFAEKHAGKLVALAGQIPGIEYSASDILAETKGDRLLLNKWAHSLALTEGGEPIAFIMGYERASEGSEQYPQDTLYISELAVKESHQKKGIARELLKSFFEKNNNLGMQHPDAPLNYSIQTNSAEWNEYVINLYKSFGFKERALKEYPNRTDLVLGVDKDDLLI